MSSFEMPVPSVKLALDGKNYGYWVARMRAYLQAVDLWEHITGESPCPPAPASPPPRPASPDAADAANGDYQQALDAYNGWHTDDARATLALVHSVEARVVDRPNAQQVWADLKLRYQPIIDATHYCLRRRLQMLRQGSDSVDAYFNQFMSIWSGLDCLIPAPDVCSSCACCVNREKYDDKSCLYDFLIRLRPEFDNAKYLLLYRDPLPSVIDALNVLRREEILLQRESNKPSAAAPAVTLPAVNVQRKKKNNRSGGRA